MSNLSEIKGITEVEVYGVTTDEITYEASQYGGFSVHAWGTYPSSSVLAGQSCKQFLNSFDTVGEVLEAYPNAQGSHPLMQRQNTFDHLPDGPDYEEGV